MSEQWVEKYRPKNLNEVVGNDTAVRQLKEWANIWRGGGSELKTMKKKGALLLGPPGVGKTTAALALANEMGWDVLELNASDKRNAAIVKTIIGAGSTTNAFGSDGSFVSSKSGKRRLIVMDEADNLTGREDRGGIKAVIEILKKTKQPIVLIANDSYKLTKNKGIKDLCRIIKFGHLAEDDIVKALRKICHKENLLLPDGDAPLKVIARNSAGDMRSAVNDLQSISMGKESIETADASGLSKRNLSPEIESVVRTILTTNDPHLARAAPRDLNVEPGFLLYYLDHNLPKAYTDINDMAAGFDILSEADIYLARVYRRSVYTFWSYANDLMTAGLVLAGKKKRDHLNVEFPFIMKQMGMAKNANKVRNGVSAKLVRYAHLASGQTTMELLPYFMTLYRRDSDFRTIMTSALRLDEKEIKYLLGDGAETGEMERLLALVTDETEKIPAALMGKSRRKGKEEEKAAEGKKEEKAPAAGKKRKEEKGPEKGEKTGDTKEEKEKEARADKKEEKEKKAKVMSLTDF